MNQILSTSIPVNEKRKKVRKNQPMAIGSVIKIFAIIMLLFGVSMIGTGSYAIYKNQMQIIEANLEPTISIENKTEKSILLKVMHKRIITKVEFRWNDRDPVVINGNNGKYLEKEIKIPSGKNTLNVVVEDENGKQITYSKEYNIKSDIKVDIVENKVKISYKSETNISYMTYKWDDGEETTITINDKKIDTEIDAMKGLHNLTIVVVDENNEIDTKEQKINGITKPKVEIDYDDEVKHFVIKASDDEQLTKVEFTLNQDPAQTYMLNLEDMNLKELEYTLPMEMKAGENILEVTVYNSNGLSEWSGVRLVKQ